MDLIKFEWLGLHLQEPMAIIMNFVISLFCFFAFFRLRKWENEANYWWRMFFLIFGISTVFGALGHAFFYYFGVFGKYPCWITGCVANVYAAKGMLSFPHAKQRKYNMPIAIAKGVVLLTLALVTQKFIFIAIDAIITYIGYTGIFAQLLVKRGVREMRFMVIGVAILIPSVFIFLLKLNPHRWFNKDDVSHILMLLCIYCFYLGMKSWGINSSNKPENV
ncbi:MAG: hypothetical protein A3D31_05885 [Candidatus Fluviicola riflensis]|nr:MAG: hypothetical protein CHH17_09130 [Candidatus Fluviicola riflensis]OGS79497.1 MAG: hypothetical protein A3D31_05885 [Candidatus Fluviicola riflensis]OGS86928.1 MAG: hypothetical protein A2724_05345 [Fluviicola sp. RIFCSPHIGHO2_01_FULL_43_53]OGS89719.1 MAG: hypothetical protein A3E30_02090 [Fluviicola sp. RIFCSPHIGHO2_12_FULL_43_24]